MTHVFYFSIIIFLFYEIFAFSESKRIRRKIKEYKQSDDKVGYCKENPAFITFSIFQLIYFAYILSGMFSSQWILFMLIFLISFIPKKKIIIRKIDSIITIGIMLFILINKYHLHINLQQLIF